MKAVVVHGAGDLRVEELPDPEPASGQVLLAVEWGGICGSDLAYVAQGISGTAILKEPMILGHESTARVVSWGDDVEGLEAGQKVAIYPPTLVGDGVLPQRLAGRTNLYPQVRYLGSAAMLPHTGGALAELIVVRPDQLVALPDSLDTRLGALAEPLSVALHAVRRVESLLAGGVAGRDVLVNGSGPIGLLAASVAKRLGANSVTAADVAPQALKLARQIGADHTVNVQQEPFGSEFEVVIEASGVAAALGGVLRTTARGGVMIQVGNLPADQVTAVLGDLVSREIVWAGSFRFAGEMPEAVQLLADGLPVEPLITHTYPVADALEAFRVAADRQAGSSKVLIQFD